SNVDETYVYCSDESICDYIPEGIKFLKRDPYLDLSTTSFNEVLTTFADKVDADVYVLTHATAPFMSKESIETGVDAIVNHGHDSALAVTKLQEFVWKDGKPFNYDVNHIPRTQDLEPLYTETCGLFVYTKDLIKNKKRRIGDNPYLVEVSKVEACDINTKEDFVIANAIFNALKK
ncbi:MAG: acylneuraminate cytidylyltransferase family protein, partial [Clostridia bacterium]|nr:acylneuraminate cytidylyltransferase family protein [Clostridia bacterium]